MSEPSESSPREADRLIYMGLLGLAAAAVLGMLEKGADSLSQQIAIHSFAAAMPLLVVGVFTDYARRAGTPISMWKNLVCVTGALLAVLGLAAIFCHYGNPAGGVFLAACIVGWVAVRWL